MLTAYNPGGESRDDVANAAAERELERELAVQAVTYWPATGRSSDGSWSEPGVAVAGVDRREACAIGTRYGQLAVFELTPGEVHVVRCADGDVVRTRTRR